MSTNFAKPTYEELLKTVKDQEFHIDRLIKKERSLNNLSFYFKESLDLICIAGTDGFLREINPAFINILGYTEQEFLSRPFITFVHPDDIAETDTEIKNLSKGNSSLDFENRYLKKNGDTVHIMWTASVDFSNEIIYAIGRDVTEKKKVREKLNASIKAEAELNLKLVEEESNYKFKNYIESAPDGVFVADENGDFVEVNDAVSVIWGYSQEELLTFSMMDLVCQESLDDFKSCLISLKSVGGSKGEFKTIHKSGEIRWSGVDSVKLSENRYLCFIKDITEIKRANELLSNTFERITDAFAALDHNWCHTYMNKKAGEILDCDPIEMIGKNIWTEFPHAINGVFYNACHESVATQVATHFEAYNESSQLWVENHIYPSENGISIFFRDITEKKKSEEITKKSENLFRALVENNDSIIGILDDKLEVLFRGAPSIRVNGYTDEEFDAIPFNEYVHPDYLGYIQEIRQIVLDNPRKPIPVLFQVKHKKGNYIWLEGHLNNHLDDDNVNGVIVNFKDVTDSKNTQDIIKKREKRFFALIENNDSIISLVDTGKKSLFRSSSSQKLTGWTDEEFDQLSEHEFFHPDCLEYVQQLRQKLFASPGVPIPALFQVKCKNGNYVWLEGHVTNMLDDENLRGVLSNLRDVTSSKSANELLMKERDKFAKIAATSPGLIYSMRRNIDDSLNFPYLSEAVDDIFGFSFEEIENNSDKMFALIHPEDIELVTEKINKTKSELVPLKGKYRYQHPTKGLVWHEVNSLPVQEIEGTVICHGIITDITDRIEAEQKLNKVNRLYLFISEINQMIVRETEEESVFREACAIAVEVGQFKMAWIGSIDVNTNRVIPEIIAGDHDGYLSIIKTISKDDIIAGSGPAGTAIREEKYIVCNDVENDLLMKPWKKAALSRNYYSLISLPIKKFGETVGVFSLYASEKNFFDAEEIALLEKATNDVSFALEVIEKEALRKKAEEAVSQSEKRYHTLTEVSPVGIFRTDAVGLTTYVNPSWCRISGLLFDQALGNGWLSAVHNEDQTTLSDYRKNAAAKEEERFLEYRFVHKDGSVSWVIEQAIPEKNSENEIIGYVGTITDITERKIAEGLIIKEKQLSEKVISNLPGIFYLYNEDGKFVKWNKNFELVTGYESHEIETMRPYDFFEIREKERIEKRIRAVFEHGLPTVADKLPGIEVEFYTKNKNKTPYFIDSLAIEYEGEKCVFGMGLDLTEKRKSEEEFKEIYEKMEAVFDAIPDLLFEVGMDGQIYNFYSRLKDLPQVYSNSIIGKTFFDILPPVAANIALLAIQEAYENGFSNGRQYSIESAIGRSWFELSIAPMQESESHDIHFICLSREITAAKEGDEALLKSEERYRGLLDNLDAGVIVHSSDSSIIMNNQIASELLGLTEDQMSGKLAVDFDWTFLNKDGSVMDSEQYPVNQIAKTKESVKNVLVGVNRPANSGVVWLLVSGYPFFDDKGDLAEIVVSFIDITDRKLMEIEILKSKEQAEHASKAKTDFLANMSHEIRTPLNAIIGYTHLLMKSSLEKNQSEYMSTINESATSLLEIVNDVLDFSKIESGKMELSMESMDLFKLSVQVIDLFKYQAQKKDIDLVLHVDKEVPQFIVADTVRLKQILVNILSNALKFTNTGVIRLDIDALPSTNKKHSKIKFSVKDTGIGIKGSNNLKIFESFVQEDNSISRKFGGTGLGLSISNQLLGLMNSKLNLISEYGEGSDFFFEIDFEKLSDSEVLNTKTDNINTDADSRALQIMGHKKLLIVEDNRINMLLAKTLVQALIPDCVIYEAKDGNEAVALYKTEMPDVILMDIQMPNKNGYEATIEIRQLKDSAEVPIIAITAGIMADDKQKCLEAGLNDYLSKPILESELKKMLVKWLIK